MLMIHFSITFKFNDLVDDKYSMFKLVSSTYKITSSMLLINDEQQRVFIWCKIVVAIIDWLRATCMMSTYPSIGFHSVCLCKQCLRSKFIPDNLNLSISECQVVVQWTINGTFIQQWYTLSFRSERCAWMNCGAPDYFRYLQHSANFAACQWVSKHLKSFHIVLSAIDQLYEIFDVRLSYGFHSYLEILAWAMFSNMRNADAQNRIQNYRSKVCQCPKWEP